MTSLYHCLTRQNTKRFPIYRDKSRFDDEHPIKTLRAIKSEITLLNNPWKILNLCFAKYVKDIMPCKAVRLWRILNFISWNCHHLVCKNSFQTMKSKSHNWLTIPHTLNTWVSLWMQKSLKLQPKFQTNERALKRLYSA